MSRVRVFVSLKNTEKEWTRSNALQNTAIKLLLFDIWILRRFRSILKRIVAVLYKMYALAVLIGLVYTLMLVHAKLNFTMQKNECTTKSIGNIHDVMSIADHSQLDERSLADEIFNLKTAAFNLELELYKTKQLYKYLRHMGFSDTLPDFASESVGGLVIGTPDTEAFHETDSVQLSLFGIPIWKSTYFSPRKIIQPWREPGECWAFKGTHGKITIELAYTIHLTHVTMEHIPLHISLTGKLDSAPKEFVVHGRYKNRHIQTDIFSYNVEGLPSQTFELKNEEFMKIPLKEVTLEILSNWGHPQYTCIYRFRVHGKIFHEIQESEEY